MRIITISSDLGQNNAEKAWLTSAFQEKFNDANVIDLYHEQNQFSLENIAYNVYAATCLFPENTIHVICCKYSIHNSKILILKAQNQFIVCTDNGILSAIKAMYISTEIFEMQLENINFKYFIPSLILAVDNICSSEHKNLPTNQNIRPMKPFETDLSHSNESIKTRIIFIDTLGNIVLNVTQSKFQLLTQDKNFTIEFFNNKIAKISDSYNDVNQSTRIGAIFNNANFLEIYMNGGNLAQLYNFNKHGYNNQIEIKLDDKAIGEINF